MIFGIELMLKLQEESGSLRIRACLPKSARWEIAGSWWFFGEKLPDPGFWSFFEKILEPLSRAHPFSGSNKADDFWSGKGEKADFIAAVKLGWHPQMSWNPHVCGLLMVSVTHVDSCYFLFGRSSMAYGLPRSDDFDIDDLRERMPHRHQQHHHHDHHHEHQHLRESMEERSLVTGKFMTAREEDAKRFGDGKKGSLGKTMKVESELVMIIHWSWSPMSNHWLCRNL